MLFFQKQDYNVYIIINSNNILFIFYTVASLAVVVPDLSDLLTLIVAVGSSGLAFPPLIHILTYWNQQQSLLLKGI